MLRLFSALAALVFGSAPAVGKTTLALEAPIGFVGAGPSEVTVPSGEYVTIVAGSSGAVQWLKDGRMIPGSSPNSLVFFSVLPTDSGVYQAIYSTSVLGVTHSQALFLTVKPSQRLVNLSTRAQVGDGEKTFIAGFVVEGRDAKKIIIRAVGPSLSEHGIEEPVAHPAIVIFDKDGQTYSSGFYYLDCVECLTYEKDLAESLIKAGAFPLPPGTDDVVKMMPFEPGAYTVHVTSADGTPGVVLLEIYEVP